MNRMNREFKKIKSDKRNVHGSVAETGNKMSLSYLLVTALVIVAGVIAPETALATAFNLNKAGAGFFDPVIEFIDNYWGRGLITCGVGGALVSQGDLITKMFGFGKGVAAGGLIYAAAKLGLGF